ncbi:MAG: hypothetical protein IPO07_13290 [Haliscomenobacter sp.]|nr:hypothetical protein [Haliscomenobacter sp.]MBK9489647.1 hypothetical protein [Haliscomenobacter sp.]
MKCLSLLFTLAFGLALNAQNTMKEFIINDEVVAAQTISQLESAYKVKFVPGNYWYDRMTGAFGRKGGPCTGVGIAGLNIGGSLKSNASGGGTGVFINGRDLHPQDVAVFQTFMQVIPGRYWMDVYGNFGSENVPFALGNVYQLYQARFGRGGKATSYYKNNPWSGETTSFGGDGSFMYFSSKKTDGTTYEYFSDH